MDTENYCKNLGSLDKKQAIRAIHEAYLQLKALDGMNDRDSCTYIDNKPALKSLENCLKNAGHIGFTD